MVAQTGQEGKKGEGGGTKRKDFDPTAKSGGERASGKPNPGKREEEDWGGTITTKWKAHNAKWVEGR